MFLDEFREVVETTRCAALDSIHEGTNTNRESQEDEAEDRAYPREDCKHPHSW